MIILEGLRLFVFNFFEYMNIFFFTTYFIYIYNILNNEFLDLILCMLHDELKLIFHVLFIYLYLFENR